ncbi:uncharacterized protein LOC123561870 [Mercenaria mercenaria]|uniref:uncharacterized protein LOC123561870 n=1 Tax=Mercenaria mercenaria TaxID=6596 RepID=UPI00234EDEC8|nr:uncharacterized protein LOC123561870 [Mercenaria mercenaria]
MSGKTGKVISWKGVPDGRESYYSPQVYTWLDGTQLVLFGTGGETHGGSLWVIKLDDLIKGDIDKAIALFTDKFKGVMTPPALADVTGDGVEDIIVPVFNASVLAINGQTFKVIWNYTQPMSESYSTPSPGFYNDDDVPDFLIKFAHGPGFPVYYHSTTTILDGKTGKPLIAPPIRDTVGAQASPITVSMEGRGNDVFLYWVADCLDHEGQGGEFKFVEGTNVHEQSRSDFCRLRFKTNGYSKIYAISQHIPPPGSTVYYSEERVEVEHSSWINTTKEGLEYVLSHPEYLDEYRRFSHPEYTEKLDINNIIPKEEGSESLFETPIFDNTERTTYKKGPSSGVFRPQSSILNSMKHNDYPDYTYPDTYYDQDQVRGRQGTAFNRGRTGYSDYDYDNYYQNAPKYQYGRDKYRERYPSNNRKDKVRQRNALNVKKISKSADNNKVKPIAMRDTRTKTRTGAKVENSAKSNIFKKIHKRSSKQLHKFGRNNSEHKRRRKRRHVGPHDEKGLQRLLSTGSLAPSLLPKDHPLYNHSVDVVFATYWFFPAKTRAILPEDQHCIEKKMSEETIRFDPKSKYYKMDHDAYEHAITDECLQKSSHDLPDEGTYESQDKYDPFNVHMGQMTVYRLRLTCTCSNQTEIEMAGKRCGQILPFNQQQWYAYMGNNADSHWMPRGDI